MNVRQLCNCVFTGKLGAWITALSCENASSSHSSSSSSSYSTRSVQPPQNSLETTTMQTFTAQYSQPGHFGLLLVNHVSCWYKLIVLHLALYAYACRNIINIHVMHALHVKHLGYFNHIFRLSQLHQCD